MVDIISFAEALADSDKYKKKHLLLGNGFSIACRHEIFTYKSLFDQADFKKNPHIEQVFEAMGTSDFEKVIRVLENAAKILPVYSQDLASIASQFEEDAELLKTILIDTLAKNHPPIPNDISEEEFRACRGFLNYFAGEGSQGQIYTLNYDLLLYWALMHEVEDDPEEYSLRSNDGFGRDEDTEAVYVEWMGESNYGQNIHYLHGALHLFDAGANLLKYTWINTGMRLLDQAQDAMTNDKFPLFVAEGTSDQKLGKIKHSAYLYRAYKSFSEQMKKKDQSLFIFGHSLDESDHHILKKISKGKVEKIYVGLYGDKDLPANRAIIATARSMQSMRPKKFNPLQVAFFNAESARVWG